MSAFLSSARLLRILSLYSDTERVFCSFGCVILVLSIFARYFSSSLNSLKVS